jgi:hypothetical protein
MHNRSKEKVAGGREVREGGGAWDESLAEEVMMAAIEGRSMEVIKQLMPKGSWMRAGVEERVAKRKYFDLPKISGI